MECCHCKLSFSHLCFVVCCGVLPFAARTGTMITAYSLLPQGYSPISFLGSGSSSGSTLACALLAPRKVFEWAVSKEQLEEELQHLQQLYLPHHHSYGEGL